MDRKLRATISEGTQMTLRAKLTCDERVGSGLKRAETISDDEDACAKAAEALVLDRRDA